MTNLETIAGCLTQTPASILDYDEWIKIGSAIKHEGGDVSMWDEWSRTDQRYKTSDCTSRWSGLDKGMTPATVASVVQICKDHGGTPPHDETYVRTTQGVDLNAEIPMDTPIDIGGKTEPAKDPVRIVRKEWLEIETLPPDDGKMSGPQMLASYIRALFQTDEHVGYVPNAFQTEPDQTGARRWIPEGKGLYSTTAGELIQSCATCGKDLGMVIGDWTPESGAWIRFNPLDGNGVSDANVTDYRYALVESDDISIDQQWTIYRKLELPIAAMVHSGGKSLHAIVRIEAPDYKEYQKRVDTLYEICHKNGLSIDRKNRNPSRLSRLPGATRAGVMQRLIGTNFGKESWAEWTDWIASQSDDLPKIESLEDVWDNLPPLADCLIDGILRKGHKMLVSGPSKAGKSFLLLELAIAIASGGDWLGWQCTKGRVLYVNLELDRASALHRIKDICDAKGIVPVKKNIYVWNLRGQSMPMDKLAPILIRRALKRPCDAIIIDPIYKVITGDENAADQMAKFCNNFDRVCSELSCSVIYCHHHSKGEQWQKKAQDRASGSGVFARDPDALIDMVELEIDDKMREAITYKLRLRALQEWLGRTHTGWKTEMVDKGDDFDDVDRVITFARGVSPNADIINSAAIKSSKSASGWRIGGILREFAGFPDKDIVFRYPLHLQGRDVSEILRDAKISGEIRPMTRDEKSAIGKEQAAKTAKKTKGETVMAYNAVALVHDVVTTRLVSQELYDQNIRNNETGEALDPRTVRGRLLKAGYIHPDGSKEAWIHKGDDDDD